MKKEAFCEKCGDFVEYDIRPVNKVGRLRSVKYQYFGKAAECRTCGSPVYVPTIHDFNLKALYDVYDNQER